MNNFQWQPVTAAPTEPGQYLCETSSERALLWWSPEHGWEGDLSPGEHVLRWIAIPP